MEVLWASLLESDALNIQPIPFLSAPLTGGQEGVIGSLSFDFNGRSVASPFAVRIILRLFKVPFFLLELGIARR